MNEEPRRCDCGWLLPKDWVCGIQRENVEEREIVAVVIIICPQCGAQLEQEASVQSEAS